MIALAALAFLIGTCFGFWALSLLIESGRQGAFMAGRAAQAREDTDLLRLAEDAAFKAGATSQRIVFPDSKEDGRTVLYPSKESLWN